MRLGKGGIQRRMRQAWGGGAGFHRTRGGHRQQICPKVKAEGGAGTLGADEQGAPGTERTTFRGEGVKLGTGWGGRSRGAPRAHTGSAVRAPDTPLCQSGSRVGTVTWNVTPWASAPRGWTGWSGRGGAGAHLQVHGHWLRQDLVLPDLIQVVEPQQDPAEVGLSLPWEA